MWYVDDLSSNRDALIAAYLRHFDEIVPLSNPEQFRQRLDGSHPDALLCDIFFYDPKEAEDIERSVEEKMDELRAFARDHNLDLPRNQAGLQLLEAIARSTVGTHRSSSLHTRLRERSF